MRRLAVLLVFVVPPIAGYVAWYVGTHPEDDAPTVLTGTVTDDQGPVAGARVRLQGAPDFILSDELGRFSLPMPNPPRNVAVYKEGYRIGGAISDVVPITIALKRLPDRDHPAYRWLDDYPDPNGLDGLRKSYGDNCRECHAAIHDEWQTSAHGRPDKNSRFQAMFLGLDGHGTAKGWGLMRDRPDGEHVCGSCHSPAASTTDFLPEDRRIGTAHRAVHCDFCHKIVGPAGELGLTHGRYALKFLRPHTEVNEWRSITDHLFFGPLDDAVRNGDNAHSPFQRQSRLCAACHEGVVFGVRVYETFSEWQASPAGKAGTQCQDCHMKPTGKMTNLAPGPGGGAERDPMTLGNHTFFDGSHREMLKNCVRLALNVSDGKAVVDLRVEDVGHRVPTGLPDRNLSLVVEAFDRDGKSLVKRDKLFAKVLKDFEGGSPVPFWRAAPEFDDNRLTPGKPERVEFALPAGAAKVTAKLVYRKFWPEVARAKGWQDDAWVVGEQEWAKP